MRSKSGIHNYLSLIILLWGVVMLGTMLQFEDRPPSLPSYNEMEKLPKVGEEIVCYEGVQGATGGIHVLHIHNQHSWDILRKSHEEGGGSPTSWGYTSCWIIFLDDPFSITHISYTQFATHVTLYFNYFCIL